MIDIREYPKATEWAIDILLEVGLDRKITAIKRLREIYQDPSATQPSRMGLLEAKIIVESAIAMIQTWDELWLISKTVRQREVGKG